MRNAVILCTVILMAFAGQPTAAIIIDNFDECDFSATFYEFRRSVNKNFPWPIGSLFCVLRFSLIPFPTLSSR